MRATPDFDFQLGESADMIRESVGRFVDEQLMPLGDKIDREDYFPRAEVWQAMGELGMHGITVAEEDGGLGLGYIEHVIAVEEVARASASLSLSYGAHSNLCINQIRRWANPEQKAKYLPKLISGEHVGSLAMSEASAGSDVVSMKLKAEEVQGGYLLNGTKFWITNAAEADTLVVYAKTDGAAGSRGITAFLIEKGMPGFSIGQKIEKVGMRGSPTNELVFDNCEVPEENVMGPVNGGVGVLMSGLDYERVVPAHWQLPANAGQGRRHVCRAANRARRCLCRRQSVRCGPDHALRCGGRDPLCERKLVQGCGRSGAGAGRRRLYHRLAGRALYARCEAARYWRWDERDPAYADRARADWGGGMSVYMISRMTIHDREQYDQYEERFMGVFEKFDGKLLSVDEEPQVVAGEWKATRSVLIEFPTKPQLFEWLTSPEYQEIGKFRDAGSTAEAIIVKGLEPGDLPS